LDRSVRDSAALQIRIRITNKTGLQRDPAQSTDDFLEAVAGRFGIAPVSLTALDSGRRCAGQ